MIFRIALALATAGFMLYFLVITRRSAFKRLFTLAFFGTGLVFVAMPDLSMRLANLVGIGRGADLVFYVSTLFLFVLAFSYNARFNSVEERQSHIVRELALRFPVQEEQDHADARD